MEALKGLLPDSVPTLPVFVQRLLETINQDYYTAQDLEKIISQDAAMSAKLLKIANSALFGLSGMVGNLSHAIVLLGTQFIQALAISLPILDASIYEKSGGLIPWKRYWSHSFACAWTGFRCIQLRYLPGTKEEAFVSGLLHDIGKPILWTYRSHEYQDVIKKTQEEKTDLLEAEQTTLGFDHAEVGGELTRHWNLPEAISAAIAGHHDIPPDDSGSSLMQLADYVTHLAGFSDGVRVPDAPPAVFAELLEAVKPENAECLVRDLQQQHAELTEMIELLSEGS